MDGADCGAQSGARTQITDRLKRGPRTGKGGLVNKRSQAQSQQQHLPRWSVSEAAKHPPDDMKSGGRVNRSLAALVPQNKSNSG